MSRALLLIVLLVASARAQVAPPRAPTGGDRMWLVAGALSGGVVASPAGPFLLIGVNALSLGLAILGYAYLFSALSSDGGRAILIATGVSVAFFFVDFISSLFDALEPLGLLSIFHYYDPVGLAVDASFPGLHVAVLLATGAVTLAAALIIFERRDIAA